VRVYDDLLRPPTVAEEKAEPDTTPAGHVDRVIVDRDAGDVADREVELGGQPRRHHIGAEQDPIA
jgi:hypothetical protein